MSSITTSEKPAASLAPQLEALLEPLGEVKIDLKGDSENYECSPLLEKPFHSLDVDVCVTESGDTCDTSPSDAPADPPGLSNPPGTDSKLDGMRPIASDDHTRSADKPQTLLQDQGVMATPVILPHLHDAFSDIGRNPFSLEGVAPLDAFIPPDLFPDELLVHDIDNVTKQCPNNERENSKECKTNGPVHYVRFYPTKQPSLKESSDTHRRSGEADSEEPNASPSSPQSPTPARIAHLYLSAANELGSGNHSTVFRAVLRLRLDSDLGASTACEDDEGDAKGWRTVSVAAKTAASVCGAHEMLLHEAKMYMTFPRELMEDRHAEPPRAPVCRIPAAPGQRPPEEAKGELGQEVDRAFLPALVPKFFGFYAPMNEKGQPFLWCGHWTCDRDSTCQVRWRTAILLMEECGRPVRLKCHPPKDREVCFSLVKRLREAGFVNGSMFLRNMVVQEGPLSKPREERTMEHPSFRVIDFGRGTSVERHGRRKFEAAALKCLKDAKHELVLD